MKFASNVERWRTSCRKWAAVYAERFGVQLDESWLLALISHESGGDPTNHPPGSTAHRGLGQVGGHGQGLDPETQHDLGAELFQPVGAARGQAHVIALAGVDAGEGGPDAGRGAGDQGEAAGHGGLFSGVGAGCGRKTATHFSSTRCMKRDSFASDSTAAAPVQAPAASAFEQIGDRDLRQPGRSGLVRRCYGPAHGVGNPGSHRAAVDALGGHAQFGAAIHRL